MTRITNSDQIVLLLQAQLEKMNRGKKKSSKPDTGRSVKRIDLMQSLAAREDMSDDELRTLLVTTILADRFGNSFINDPNVQAVASKVSKMIAADPEAEQLFRGAMAAFQDQD